MNRYPGVPSIGRPHACASLPWFTPWRKIRPGARPWLLGALIAAGPTLAVAGQGRASPLVLSLSLVGGIVVGLLMRAAAPPDPVASWASLIEQAARAAALGDQVLAARCLAEGAALRRELLGLTSDDGPDEAIHLLPAREVRS